MRKLTNYTRGGQPLQRSRCFEGCMHRQWLDPRFDEYAPSQTPRMRASAGTAAGTATPRAGCRSKPHVAKMLKRCLRAL